MAATETLVRSGGRLNIIAYIDGSIEVLSLVTRTSVVVPSADLDMLISELQTLADSRRTVCDPAQERLQL